MTVHWAARRLPSFAALILCVGCGGGQPVSEAVLSEVGAAVGLPAPDPGWPDGTGWGPEIMGPGVGFVDLDADGRLDVVQLTMPRPGESSAALATVHLQGDDGRFRPRPIEAEGWAQGVAAGDVNGDGLPDLFLANVGADVLLLNRGGGRFEPWGESPPWGDAAWSVSAAFCDHDGDGDLDLYVARYLDADPSVRCSSPAGGVGYCAPSVFPGISDRLYRNDGSGFTDVSGDAGLLAVDAARAKGLGVACADLNDDGRLDFYVANDGESNQLWTNLGDGRFADEAVLRGVAVNRNGRPEASMGIAVGDINGDLGLDLMLTHLEGENNTVYRSMTPVYEDRTASTGLALHDFERTGFGCALIDLELDGDLDFLVVNGKVRRSAGEESRGDGFWGRYAEPNQAFENLGDGTFRDVSAREGAFSREIAVTRGLAYGDVDNDGDLDVVISAADNGLRLYRNDAQRAGRHWLRVVARGARGGTALGARVELLAGGRRFRAVVPAGSSYASQHDTRLSFGLGALERIDAIEITWPDGRTEVFPGGEVDRELVLTHGRGRSG